MNLTELKAALRAHPALNVGIVLPDGGSVPAHYHVTEVGHIAKKFIDCGGTFRASETCLLQTWMSSRKDDGHRLTAGRLAKILELANSLLPSDELPVEVEYEHGVISQFPLVKAAAEGATLILQLGSKHTDCLAREKCGVEESGVCDRGDQDAGEACCSGVGAGAGDGRSCCS